MASVAVGSQLEDAVLGGKKAGQISWGSTPIKAAMAKLARGWRLPNAQLMLFRERPISSPIRDKFDPRFLTAAMMSARCQPGKRGSQEANFAIQKKGWQKNASANQRCLKIGRKMPFQSSRKWATWHFFSTWVSCDAS